MEENIVNFDNNNCDNDDDDANDLLQVSTYVLYSGYTESTDLCWGQEIILPSNRTDSLSWSRI